MKYEFSVGEPYKTFLLNGEKIIEGRLNRGKFSKLIIGDILFFTSGEEFQIVNLTYYNTFYEMIKSKGIKNILPDIDKIEEGLDVYYDFYTKEDENRFGVVGIELKLLD